MEEIAESCQPDCVIVPKPPGAVLYVLILKGISNKPNGFALCSYMSGCTCSLILGLEFCILGSSAVTSLPNFV
jgi:hypothetical protein